MSLALARPYIDGVMLAINAIPDSALVVDSPWCGQERIERIAPNHDWNSDLSRYDGNHRVRLVQFDPEEAALGTEARLRDMLAETARLRHPEVLFACFSGLASLFESWDMMRLESLKEDLGTTLLELPGDPLDMSVSEGYATVLERAARHFAETAKTESPQKGHLSLIGHFHDRNEADRAADREELKRLVSLLGLELDTIWLDGSPWKALSRIASSETIVSLPYAGKAGSIIAKTWGRNHGSLPLPLGIAASEEWLVKLGLLCGEKEKAQLLAEQESVKTAKTLLPLAERRFLGKNAAVCADANQGPALTKVLQELGFHVALVSIQSFEQEEKNVQGMKIFSGLTVAELKGHLQNLAESGSGLDLILGSSIEREAAKDCRAAYVEVGWPSWSHHSVFPQPTLGFRGVLGLADRINAALTERNLTKK